MHANDPRFVPRLRLLLLQLAQEAPYSADERSAVLTAVDGLFAAMLARDGAAVAPLVELGEGLVTVDIGGMPTAACRMASRASWADFAARLGSGARPYSRAHVRAGGPDQRRPRHGLVAL